MLRELWSVEEDSPEPERHRHLLRDVVLPGGAVGTMGAAVMTVLAFAGSAIFSDDPWRPARLVASVFSRESVPQGAGAVFLGLFIHFAVAGGLGTAFAFLIPRGKSGVALLSLGMLFALSLQVILPALVLPWVAPPLVREDSLPALIPLHLAFGASLALLSKMRELFTALEPWVLRWRNVQRVLG